MGRSRFCIHPQPSIEQIPKVGGTKDVNWEKIKTVNPDIIILDKEENTLEMAQTCPFDYVALHIESINDVAKELIKLNQHLENNKLQKIAERWQAIARNKKTNKITNLEDFPGIIQWWKRPTKQQKLLYLIWQDPWMAIGNNTFIQSVIDKLGFETQRIQFDEKYPTINLQDYPTESTLLLFSSEPFPFERYKDQLLKLGYGCALVDGEYFSWYGLRSLAFLEREFLEKQPL